MRVLKKIIVMALFVVLAFLITWLLGISFSQQGLWTLLYLPQAALLILFTYIYAPVMVSILARSRLKRLVWTTPVEPGTSVTPHHLFNILIPAHNEAKVLPALLESIRAQDYPAEFYQTWVVADNCSDNTADLARRYGAQCIERHTERPSNKGQALSSGWQEINSRQSVMSRTIILLVDADCELKVDYLSQLNQSFARPDSAEILQSFRAISNYQASTVSTLDAAAEALRQWVELGSRAVMGLDGRICGTGVGFRYEVFAYLMEKQQHNLAEDKAWQAHLFERGYRVGWCPAAHLSTQSTESGADFQKQRNRWVGGQLALIKMYAASMLWQGLVRGSLSQLDYAMSIIQLPRSFMLGLAGLLGLIAFVVPISSILVWWGWCLLAGLFFVYAAYGLFLIKAPGRLYLRLLLAPALVARVFWITLQGLLGRRVQRWEAMRSKPDENNPELVMAISPTTQVDSSK